MAPKVAPNKSLSKLEVDVEIKADAKAFHEVFSCRPHHVSNASPGKIKACDLHEGEWGKPGKIINWNYFHDGKHKTAKEKVEVIDDEKNMTRYRVLEGDLMEDYKTFFIEVQATPKPDGAGAVVHWTLEYELKHDHVPHPETLVDFVVEVTKDTDAHLIAAASADPTAATAAPATAAKVATCT